MFGLRELSGLLGLIRLFRSFRLIFPFIPFGIFGLIGLIWSFRLFRVWKLLWRFGHLRITWPFTSIRIVWFFETFVVLILIRRNIWWWTWCRCRSWCGSWCRSWCRGRIWGWWNKNWFLAALISLNGSFNRQILTFKQLCDRATRYFFIKDLRTVNS